MKISENSGVRSTSFRDPYGFLSLQNSLAFPFEMSPEYAQRQMAKWAAVICDGLNGSAALSALATFLPFVDYKRPTRFSAAYFPAWVINAEVEVDVSVRGSEVPFLLLSCYITNIGFLSANIDCDLQKFVCVASVDIFFI